MNASIVDFSSAISSRFLTNTEIMEFLVERLKTQNNKRKIIVVTTIQYHEEIVIFYYFNYSIVIKVKIISANACCRLMNALCANVNMWLNRLGRNLFNYLLFCLVSINIIRDKRKIYVREQNKTFFSFNFSLIKKCLHFIPMFYLFQLTEWIGISEGICFYLPFRSRKVNILLNA